MLTAEQAAQKSRFDSERNIQWLTAEQAAQKETRRHLLHDQILIAKQAAWKLDQYAGKILYVLT